jgi:hypothetical protein
MYAANHVLCCCVGTLESKADGGSGSKAGAAAGAQGWLAVSYRTCIYAAGHVCHI